jgi:hypothetical protein
MAFAPTSRSVSLSVGTQRRTDVLDHPVQSNHVLGVKILPVTNAFREGHCVFPL